MNARGRVTLRAVVAVALAIDVSLFVAVVALRVGFPHQLEWMTGSVLDHIERVRAGRAVYAEPTASWIPYIYPPLYYWLGALLGGSYLACRLVSLASAFVQAALALRIAKELGASRFWCIAAAALFFACFPYLGWWYDIERSDTLFGAMALVTCTLAMRARTPRAHAFAGALAGLAFLAKQQAVFYAAGAMAPLVFLWWRERTRARLYDALAFGAPAALVPLGLVLWENHRSGGWFAYYVLEMPRAHGLTWSLAKAAFPHDLGGGFLLVAATLAMAFASLPRRKSLPDRGALVFTSMLLAGFVGALSSRLHIGGWINVLQPWTSFACVAAAVLASRAEGWGDRSKRPLAVRATVAALFIAQLAVWFHDPMMQVPRRGAAAATERFHAVVRELERGGEVLLVGRGHVTRERHFQMSALADVVAVEGRSPPDLVAGLTSRRFAAIIDDARLAGERRPTWWPPVMLEDFADLRAPLVANYFVARRIEEEHAALPMVAPAMPRWILLPRIQPLGLPEPQLIERHLAEIRLAQDRADVTRRGGTPTYSEADIETLAGTAH